MNLVPINGNVLVRYVTKEVENSLIMTEEDDHKVGEIVSIGINDLTGIGIDVGTNVEFVLNVSPLEKKVIHDGETLHIIPFTNIVGVYA